jgi:hypothetical protein
VALAHQIGKSLPLPFVLVVPIKPSSAPITDAAVMPPRPSGAARFIERTKDQVAPSQL